MADVQYEGTDERTEACDGPYGLEGGLGPVHWAGREICNVYQKRDSSLLMSGRNLGPWG